MGDNQQGAADYDAGIAKLFVMLVEELDANGSLDKTLFVRRIFDSVGELEAEFDGSMSASARAIVDQLSAVARLLDAK